MGSVRRLQVSTYNYELSLRGSECVSNPPDLVLVPLEVVLAGLPDRQPLTIGCNLPGSLSYHISLVYIIGLLESPG